ncbi:MAG: TerD family protein [Dysgonomonas sp.]
MAINLQKGQKIDIGLTKMTVGLGWDPNEGTGFDFDLDASAFMIDSNRLIPSEQFFVYYGLVDNQGNPIPSPDGAVKHTGP